mmetsp:Transcript_21121/g.58925  ORF Transcript_21121/g.58925 Transcript_21121/m.58925 type:complete len:243 (-) Transcript_21121:618-1346(-)
MRKLWRRAPDELGPELQRPTVAQPGAQREVPSQEPPRLGIAGAQRRGGGGCRGDQLNQHRAHRLLQRCGLLGQMPHTPTHARGGCGVDGGPERSCSLEDVKQHRAPPGSGALLGQGQLGAQELDERPAQRPQVETDPRERGDVAGLRRPAGLPGNDDEAPSQLVQQRTKSLVQQIRLPRRLAAYRKARLRHADVLQLADDALGVQSARQHADKIRCRCIHRGKRVQHVDHVPSAELVQSASA